MGFEVAIGVIVVIVVALCLAAYLWKLRKSHAVPAYTEFKESLSEQFVTVDVSRNGGSARRVGGLTVMNYEHPVDTIEPRVEEKPASVRDILWSFCTCGAGKNKNINAPTFATILNFRNGRLTRKPVEQKMQRSTGASRMVPRKIDWSMADPNRWSFPSVEFDGSMFYRGQPEMLKDVPAPIQAGIDQLKAAPQDYDGIYYQTNMTEFPPEQQRYTLVKRTGSGFGVNASPGGGFTWMSAKYSVLEAIESIVKDRHTDSVINQLGGKRLGDPVTPGRGYGCADIPGLKIIGDVDPSDINQGGVGDCWLLSAISALAEFDGAISKLFRKTSDLQSKPSQESNTYIVTLYDLKTWEPVDIEVDERLCCKASGGLLGAEPSVDGELWVCYVEKAVAIHCGGWDKIDGGQCTHGWRLLTGCQFQYTFMDEGDGFGCYGAMNPNTGKWEELANSPHDGFQGLWPMPWPEAGGGGKLQKKINATEMFERMCAWDDHNYVMGAGSKAGSDTQSTDGIVDGHAYTILTCIDNAGGTQFDMIKLRNPHGRGEFDKGIWDDNGTGWDQYPSVKDACKPVKADDGVFWMDADSFFEHFRTIYLCAQDMTEFIQQ